MYSKKRRFYSGLIVRRGNYDVIRSNKKLRFFFLELWRWYFNSRFKLKNIKNGFSDELTEGKNVDFEPKQILGLDSENLKFSPVTGDGVIFSSCYRLNKYFTVSGIYFPLK